MNIRLRFMILVGVLIVVMGCVSVKIRKERGQVYTLDKSNFLSEK